ncbi:MAG: hypothetical protein Q9M31_00055 [Mariprofundus sp.]|nr:hypothetical protein [Mariprofundus sp.]
MKRKFLTLLLLSLLGASLLPMSLLAGEWDFFGKLSMEGRFFPNSPAYASQKPMTLAPSVTLEPELVYGWNDDYDRVYLSPFARLDANDHKRTHVDLREFNWLHLASDWSIRVGLGKVFWGVTESRHLVDIINQSDAVEDISGEEKLGQAMVNVTLERRWGTVSMFILPGFRPTTFSADDARLHGPLPIDSAHPSYQSGRAQRHVDWALRWSHTLGDLDLALSHFQGTSREARLLLGQRAGQPWLQPHYGQIGQSGLELQWTRENTLWKGEAISRTGQGRRFYAAVAGFEHTLYGVAGSVIDIGLLMEYLYDGRDPRFAPPTMADHDLFAGFRIVLNDRDDSTLLVGGSWDHRNYASFINIEGERRLTDRLKLTLTGRFFMNIPATDPLWFMRQDDYLELKLARYF